MKIRRKPIELEAIKWTFDPSIKGVCCKTGMGCSLKPHIHGPRGMVEIHAGDWLITGLGGCVYPVDEDLFYQLYEVISE
jgi:hypothetical protein